MCRGNFKTTKFFINNAKGFDCGDADGDCGEKTVAAIIALQIAYGLGVDGECGKMTWAVLING